MKLTAKQENFCQLVSEGNTYADSYREAYPVSKKWKDRAVWVTSSELMTNGKVLVRVQELREEIRKRNQATLDGVLIEMASWLKFDPIEMFDEHDALKTIHQLPESIRKSIASFEVVELFENIDKEKIKVGELKRVKLVDKRATADMFLKKFGAYITNLNVKTDDLSHLSDLLKGIEE